MKKIIAISTIALIAGVVSASAENHARFAGSSIYATAATPIAYRRYWRRSRNTGPVYGRGYMNCINSGHPADFCKTDSSGFRD